MPTRSTEPERDIRSELHSEPQLSAEALRDLVQHVPAIVWLLRGPEHRVELANVAARRGQDESELEGRPFAEVRPELAEQGLVAMLDRAYATGEPRTGREQPVRVRAPGSGETEEGYYSFTLQPVRAGGVVTGVLVVAFEMTDQVNARRELEALAQEVEEARSLLDTLIDTAPTGFALFDRDMRYVRVNEALARIHGLPAADHVGRTPREVAPGIPESGLEEPLRRVFETGEAVTGLEVGGRVGSDPGRERWLLKSYYPVRGRAGELIAAGSFVVDITERKLADQERERLLAAERAARERAEAAEGRATFIARASMVLDAAIGHTERLSELVRLVVPEVADYCTVRLLDDRGPGLVVVRHRDPVVQARLEELRGGDQTWGATPPWVLRVLETGEPALIRDFDAKAAGAAAADPVFSRVLEAVQGASLMCVPLRARGRTLGTMSFVAAAGGRRFDADDLALAEELGRRAGLAVDNSRLFEAEHASREAAERRRDRFARLQLVAAALSSAVTRQEVARTVVEAGIGALGASAGLVVERVGAQCETIASSGYPPDLAERLTSFPADSPYPVAHAVMTGEAVWLQTESDWAERFQPPSAPQPTGAAVPLVVRGRVTGAIGFRFANAERSISGMERSFLLTLAELTAQALERARLYEEQLHIARTLQESLLPGRLADIPGVSVAVRYAAAGEGNEVGGDFYDLFPTSKDSWAVVVGDVCGKGAEAAALTALVRYTLRAGAPGERRPARLLARVNDAILRQRDDRRFCTVVLGRLVRTDSGAYVILSSAGHCPPIVIRRSGAVEVTRPTGTALGLFPDPDLAEVSVELRTGDRLLFYTDGVIEGRGRDGIFGEERLIEVLERLGDASPDAVAERVMRAAVRFQAGTPRDDIALLVVGVGI